MKAREGVMSSEIYKDNLHKLYPVIEEGMSDSGCIDNVLEFLCMASNRTLPEVCMSATSMPLLEIEMHAYCSSFSSTPNNIV